MPFRLASRRTALTAGFLLLLVIGLAWPGGRQMAIQQLQHFLANLADWGPWGPPMVGLLFIPVCLLFLPGSWLTLFAGFAFGKTWPGFLASFACVSAGSTLGASLAFLAGRTLVRDQIDAWVHEQPRFQLLDAKVRQRGFWIVFLSRLSPLLPFNLLNYAFGITQVSLRDYVLGSWLGMLPGTLLFLSLGTALGNLAEVWTERREQPPLHWLLLSLGVVATLVLAMVLGRIASRNLAEGSTVDATPSSPTTPPAAKPTKR